jgi:hypothetical protein
LLQELPQLRPEFERCAVGCTTINRDELIYFQGQNGVHARCVTRRDKSRRRTRLNGLNTLSSEFGISFDNFHTMRRCRLIWRHDDFVGASFQG